MPHVKSILVVDDDGLLLDLVRMLLEVGGREVTVAKDGLEGTHFIQTRRFDAVLTDLDMPLRSGLEMLADLRRISPETRIVAMSGEWNSSKTDLRKMAGALGIRAFIGKPFALPALVELLESDLSVPDPFP